MIFTFGLRVRACAYVRLCARVCEYMSVVVIDQLSGRVRDSSDTGIIITDAQLLFVWLELEFLFVLPF